MSLQLVGEETATSALRRRYAAAIDSLNADMQRIADDIDRRPRHHGKTREFERLVNVVASAAIIMRSLAERRF